MTLTNYQISGSVITFTMTVPIVYDGLYIMQSYPFVFYNDKLISTSTMTATLYK